MPRTSLVFGLALALHPTSAAAGDLATYDRTVDLVANRFLEANTFDSADAFDKAAEAAEDAIPWLIVEAKGGVATLIHGERGQFAVVSLGAAGTGGTAELPAALDRLEDAIRTAPSAVPADVDLPVELLRGVSRALDRHSVVLARGRLERFDERIKGKLTGIGARIGASDGELVVKELFADSPALFGGLHQGDVIVRIDGFSTVGMTVDQSVKRIRGEEGSDIELVVRRMGDDAQPVELTFVLTRAEVTIPNVTWQMRPSGVGLIAIDHFSEQTARLMRDALADFEGGAVPLRGIVLDLRGDSGGSMIQACRSADLFLDDGTVLETAGRDGSRVDNLLREYRAHPEGIEPAVPLAVLVDSGSASASEILAGSLMLLDRAVLLGDHTHGKGTVQKLFTIRGGDDDEKVRLKLTVAEYRLPGGVSIERGVGLAPDLWLDRAVFNRGGAWLPREPAEDRLTLTFVDERPGWREADEVAGSADYLLSLAERVVLEARGVDRLDAIAALERVVALARHEEDTRMERTFGYRGLDWQPADEAGPAPLVDVSLEMVDEPVAGSAVEVRAVVRNRGDAPLYRAQVRLTATGGGGPFDGVTLPIGFLPPGETGFGSGVITLDPDQPSREDLLAVTLSADRRPAVSLDNALLRVDENPPPPLAVTARLVPEDDHHRVELTLENGGDRTLSGLRARLVLPETEGFELVDREGPLAALHPHVPERVDVGVRVATGTAPLEFELRVDAEVFGRVLRLPITLPVDGTPVHFDPPAVATQAPLAAPLGPLLVRAEATDDRRVESVTAWVRNDKVAWVQGHGPRVVLDVPVELVEGTQTVVIEAADDQGAVTRRTLYVRGVTEDAAAGTEGEP